MPASATGRIVGLIFPPSGDAAGLLVGGITVMERQARLLQRLGAVRLVVVDPEPLTLLPAGAEIVRAGQLADRIDPGDQVMVIAAGLVIDARAVEVMVAAPLQALLVRASGMVDHVERLDADTLSAGIMALPGAMVRAVAAEIGEWDLFSTLLRTAAVAPATQRIDLDGLPRDDPALARNRPMLWVRPTDAETAQAATRALVAATQPGRLDWPGRWVHPRVEDPLVRWLAPTRVTMDMVMVAGLALAVAAAVAIVMGALWAGLGLALLSGPADGLAAKLARTRGSVPRDAATIRRLDAAVGVLWVLALGWHFAGVPGPLAGSTIGPLASTAISALVLLPGAASAALHAAFRRWTGTDLDSVGIWERRLRLCGASRNTLVWGSLPFAAAGAWWQAFAAMAIAGVVSAALWQWRFTARLDAVFGVSRQQVATNRR